MSAQQSSKGRYQFANYFVSVKTASTKLNKDDEKEAVKKFLDGKHKNEDKEEDDDDVEMDGSEDQSQPNNKVPRDVLGKNRHMESLRLSLFPKMDHLLQCDFNLLIHGVGSKIDFLNYFCQTCLIQTHNRNVHIFNGFTAQCSMRAIVGGVKTHLMSVRSELLGENRDPLVGNMVLHEKVSVLKREFEDLR